jgi:pimeloyl-ACP methyl ester carboxylesterase
MSPTLHTLTHTRRCFLGSAAITMLAARLGMTGSARARTTTTISGALPEGQETTMTATHQGATPDTSTVRPFQVDISQADLDDLRRRVAATRWPSKELVADWSQGVQLATNQALARFWATDYDWRTIEAKLNALPQFTTEIDGVNIHFIHVKSKHENALPLIITHGWPGSVLEMLGVIGPLTDPTAHGGDAADAFDVVIPSIPGFGFSNQPAELGWNAGRVAAAWGPLMTRLGYDRFVAQGGDVGAQVTDAMGRLAPAGLLGVHLNFLIAFPPKVVAVAFGGAPAPEGLPADEQTALTKVTAAFRRGYIAEMGEHPQTIGYPQADSPAALAAWILDHDADSYQKISQAFLGGQSSGGLTRDSVVDNISLYWLTNTGVSSARAYWESGQAAAAAATAGQQPPPMALPAAFTVFPGEIYQAPRSRAEQNYHKLVYWNEVDRRGHFAAWEQPELFAEEVRAGSRSLR